MLAYILGIGSASVSFWNKMIVVIFILVATKKCQRRRNIFLESWPPSWISNLLNVLLPSQVICLKIFATHEMHVGRECCSSEVLVVGEEPWPKMKERKKERKKKKVRKKE